MSMILGAVAGLLTFFIWGVAILIKGSPFAAKSAIAAMYVGLQLSLVMAVIVALTGLIFGGDKLARLLGILWGTDQEFNKDIHNKVGYLVCRIPTWFVYLLLGLVIIGSYGYLAARF